MRYCTRCRSSYQLNERFCPLDGGVVVEEEAARDPLIGQTLAGRYLLSREIGKGGMGVVYEAEHTGLGKRVAVKLLLDTFSEDREVLARFHMEARNASRIGHENIIDILDIGDAPEHGGRSFIVMEYLEGMDLRHWHREAGAVPNDRLVGIFRQICRALAAAHAKDIIHRDMKPENVFVTERGGRRDFVKLMDFGISKIKAARDSQVRLTQTGEVVGTPLYMAPEQALGKTDIDHRADVYSLGVMMYELFTGQPPFQATTYLGLMTQHVHERPTPPRKLRGDLPAPLERVILRALEKDPARRFASMDELAAALPALPASPSQQDAPHTVMSGSGSLSQPVRGVPTNAATLARAPARSRLLWIAIASAVAVVATAITLAIVFGGGGPRRPPAPGGVATTPGPAPQPAPGGAPAVVPLAPYGSLELRSEPAGADVYLDGKLAGQTPLTLREVPLGTHALRLELRGHVPIEVQKIVRGDVSETFVLTPERRGGRPGGTPAPAATGSSPVSPAPTTAPPEPPPPEPKKPEPDDKKNPYLDDKPNPYVDD